MRLVFLLLVISGAIASLPAQTKVPNTKTAMLFNNSDGDLYLLVEGESPGTLSEYYVLQGDNRIDTTFTYTHFEDHRDESCVILSGTTAEGKIYQIVFNLGEYEEYRQFVKPDAEVTLFTGYGLAWYGTARTRTFDGIRKKVLRRG